MRARATAVEEGRKIAMSRSWKPKAAAVLLQGSAVAREKSSPPARAPGKRRPALSRRDAEGLPEAFGIVGPDLGIDDARRPLAVERIEDLLGGDTAHVLAGLPSDACGVRA